MPVLRKKSLFYGVLFLLLIQSGAVVAQNKKIQRDGSLEKLNQKMDRHISRISEIHDIFEKLLASAKASNTYPFEVINCFTVKRDFVRGFLQSAQRAKLYVKDAHYQKDQVAVEGYKKRVQEYEDNSEEFRASIPECSQDAGLLASAGIVDKQVQDFLEEGEVSVDTTDLLEDWHGLPGTEGFPVVAPASPFL